MILHTLTCALVPLFLVVGCAGDRTSRSAAPEVRGSVSIEAAGGFSAPTEQRADSLLTDAFARLNGERWETCDSTRALQKIVGEVLSDPASMNWDLPATHDLYWGPWTIRSDDDRVRIVNWTWVCTGTWRFYPFVAAVRDLHGEHAVHFSAEYLGDTVDFPGTGWRELFHLRDSLYLGITFGQFSNATPFEHAGVVTITADTMYWTHMPFHARDTTVPSITVDKNWYVEHVEQFDYAVPQVIQYSPKTGVLQIPTAMYEGKRNLTEVRGMGHDITVDTTHPIRFRFTDSAFVEL